MTDKNFPGEEIIKGLNELSLHTGFQEKHIQVLNAALDFVNRQKETIETLRKCVEQHHIIRKDSKSPLSLLTEEIRAEAYKEFAKRIRECCTSNDDLSADAWFSITTDIDCVLKELVGEK